MASTTAYRLNRDQANRNIMKNVSRRDFLSLGAGLAASSPLLALARPTQDVVVGTGEWQFVCLHDWLLAPGGHLFGDTHGLAQDSRGRIYVAHTAHHNSIVKDAVCVYSEQGEFLTSWGAEYRGGAHGLDIRREGRREFLYHCDTQRRLVVKTDLDGKIVWSQGAPMQVEAYKSGQPFVPTNVAFGDNNRLFVADGYGSSYIHVYEADGTYVKTFAGRGSEKGLTNSPHGIYLDRRGKEPLLAVADRSNRRIQYFDQDGKHVAFVTAGMRLPCHFSERKGVLLVPDLDSVVTLLDEKNKVIAHLGDGAPSSLRGRPKEEFTKGKFVHPHDAIFLRNGDILVAEWVPQGRITLLKRKR